MERELVRRYADAFEADDIDGIVALLTDDAWLTMPPSPLQYQGRAAIHAFLSALGGWQAGRDRLLVATRANTQPAFAIYRADADAPVAEATGLLVLTLSGTRIAAITHFLHNTIVRQFALSTTISR